MPLDEEKYFHYLSDMQMSDAAKRALIRDLWGILSCMADLAFDQTPETLAVDKAKTKLGSDGRRRLYSVINPDIQPSDQEGPE